MDASDGGSAQRSRMRKNHNNQLIKAESKQIRIRIWNTVFVGRLFWAFTKPGANRPTKYNAFQKQFNNQLAQEDGKEWSNSQLECEKECNERDLKIRGKQSDKNPFFKSIQ